MRKAEIIDLPDGTVKNILDLPDDPGEIPYAPPAGRSLVDDDGTAEIGGTWDGAQFLAKPPRDPVEVELEQELEAARLLGRAIDETFLDGFWLVFRAIPAVGVSGIDDAVAADDRAAFDLFFRDQVKAKM